MQSPDASPALDAQAHTKPLPKGVPTATKAAPPMRVQDVARPANKPIAPPNLGKGKGGMSPRPVPQKRTMDVDNTAAKVARLLGPSPKAAPVQKGTERSLMRELDGVSESKGSPRPDSSLVFPPGEGVRVAGDTQPLANFTPVPSPSLAPSVAHEADTAVTSKQMAIPHAQFLPCHFATRAAFYLRDAF